MMFQRDLLIRQRLSVAVNRLLRPIFQRVDECLYIGCNHRRRPIIRETDGDALKKADNLPECEMDQKCPL